MPLEHTKARLLCWCILVYFKNNSTHLYVIGMSIIQCAESKRFALQVIRLVLQRARHSRGVWHRLDIVDALALESAPNVCFPLMLDFKQEALQ